MSHSVLVIGLGRFGSAASLELVNLGHEVMAIDSDQVLVNELASRVTRASQLDATGNFYHGYVDVTTMVRSAGNGVYWLANVQSSPGASDVFGGWSLVVAYRLATDPSRNLVVYDGFADVNPGPRVDVSPGGFVTPLAGQVRTRLGVVAGELLLLGPREADRARRSALRVRQDGDRERPGCCQGERENPPADLRAGPALRPCRRDDEDRPGRLDRRRVA